MKSLKACLFSITTITLITLSWQVHASQCNEQEWNKALVSQQALDRKYNLLATKYNDWLPSFQQAIFLHIEFSNEELSYLWNKNTNQFQEKVVNQINTALESRLLVNDLIQYLDTIPNQVSEQLGYWNDIGQACEREGLISNEVAAGHYVKSDQQLTQDLINLKEQLATMRRYYDREVLSLQNISSAPSP